MKIATQVLCAFVLGMGVQTAAADYPERNITLVVPFPPGGGNDAIARVIRDGLSRLLGATIVVENRSGAGGVAGTLFVRNAGPDGYTLLLGHSGTMAINPHIYPGASYHPTRDFTPIGLISEVPLALIVNRDLPVQTVGDLVSLAKARPDELSYGSSGGGTGAHMSGELFAYQADLDVAHIPYRGSGPATTDLLSGQIDYLFGVIPSARAQLASGATRVLAVTGAERSPALPDVPTMQEAGIEGYESVLIYGLVAPAGTPPEIVEMINAALNTVLSDPGTQAQLLIEGSQVRTGSPEESGSTMEADLEKWRSLIQNADIGLY